MDTKKITIGVLLATTAVFGVLAFKAPTVIGIPEVTQLGNVAPVVNVPAPVVNVEVPKAPAPIVNVNVPQQKLGSVSSPDIQSPYFSYGDVRFWAGSTNNLAQATTTVCAIQAPASTSTLQYGSIRFSVGSTTASLVTFAKAATAFATTTSLGQFTVAANAQGTAFASTTLGTAIFAPNEWFVVGMQGGVGTFSPTGRCLAEWVQN